MIASTRLFSVATIVGTLSLAAQGCVATPESSEATQNGESAYTSSSTFFLPSCSAVTPDVVANANQLTSNAPAFVPAYSPHGGGCGASVIEIDNVYSGLSVRFESISNFCMTDCSSKYTVFFYKPVLTGYRQLIGGGVEPVYTYEWIAQPSATLIVPEGAKETAFQIPSGVGNKVLIAVNTENGYNLPTTTQVYTQAPMRLLNPGL